MFVCCGNKILPFNPLPATGSQFVPNGFTAARRKTCAGEWDTNLPCVEGGGQKEPRGQMGLLWKGGSFTFAEKRDRKRQSKWSKKNKHSIAVLLRNQFVRNRAHTSFYYRVELSEGEAWYKASTENALASFSFGRFVSAKQRVMVCKTMHEWGG